MFSGQEGISYLDLIRFKFGCHSVPSKRFQILYMVQGGNRNIMFNSEISRVIFFQQVLHCFQLSMQAGVRKSLLLIVGDEVIKSFLPC